MDAKSIEWKDRAHFFAISANLMRRILVDFARRRGYKKRGGGIKQVSLKETLFIFSQPGPNLVKLDDALDGLAKFYPREARVVELRFCGGLTLDETAEVLKVSRDTVKSDWRFAKGLVVG
jgi:RNA polymerase sigma-70 factor (ECF subfamily)